MIVLLSHADTELLAAAGSGADYRVANPGRVEPAELPELLSGADVVVVRLLGGRSSWQQGLDELLRLARVPVVVLGGEQAPDAELQALSTAPAGVVTEALAYLAGGGTDNLANLARFLSDTLLLTGEGFAPPAEVPAFGVRAGRAERPDRPTVGIVYYRAHEISGNAGFIEVLADAIEAAGGNARAVFTGSLRGAGEDFYALLDGVDSLVVTVLAAGGATAADASAGGDDDAWDVGALRALDVSVLQGLCLTSSRATWSESDAGLSPLDAAMQVAIPEFDGRLITVPFSFKEVGADGLARYVADPERAGRVAGLAVRHARLRRTPPAEKKVALVLSSYPTKHARVGNAVGLDTPASAVLLLQAMRDAGYLLADPGSDVTVPDDGDTLIHTLIAAGGHDVEWLTEEQLANATARVPLAEYRAWFEALPTALTDGIREHWGEPPGELYVDDSAGEPEIVLATLRFGNVLLMIQPPRGFGENPVAIYHDPDLPPSHHYLAAYRWLEQEFRADAVLHLGKHGTLEWLPGKGLGLGPADAPDAVLGNLPLIYPFLVNDPGEGTQAKRRAHATIVDHLVPPMARADSYGDLAKLEQLLDEHASVAAMDPAKLPAIRAQIWTLLQAAQLHSDLGVTERPPDEDFDDFLLHVDGYLCEVKDVLIRDGLHILGAAPTGEPRVNLVLAILRATQVWGGRSGALPGLRTALGLLPGSSARLEVDGAEQVAHALVDGMEAAGWDADKAAAVTLDVLGQEAPEVARVLEFGAAEVVPRLARTTDEIAGVLHALDGGYVPAGPSGSPTRGLVNVLPTGRNFSSVDPKAVPSRLAWEVGTALADSLLQRHREDTGEWPRSVGLTVWGTSAMRTSGDDIAEVLALLGCRPRWDDASRRVVGVDVVPLAELGRPRIDVTLRISGFFRDAFPHVVAMLDDAICTVAGLDEPAESNYLRAHALEDLAGAVVGGADRETVGGADRETVGEVDRETAWRRATSRIFGSKPGAYGAGLLPLIDAGNWRTDADLAEVYAVWGGYAYGRGLDGRDARPDMENAFRRISVAAKNQDTREHDLVDSDDYFQYHGGMVAMVRSLTGRDPAAYVGDSATPDAVKTRTLREETHRVFRARVVNPRWIAAMQRHGYKGAFELAATVDYLFGYDATTGVVDDWMYEKLAASYVFDPQVRSFLEQSNPWALRGMSERLLEAAERGLWAEPDADTLAQLRAAYLQTEGDLEGR